MIWIFSSMPPCRKTLWQASTVLHNSSARASTGNLSVAVEELLILDEQMVTAAG
jgi:hypothetical protein